jgi:hypothetical protein
MGRLTRWLAVAACAGAMAPGQATAQISSGTPVRTAAEKFVPGVTWRAATVLQADFACAGKMQQAILGSSANEIVVGIFTDGLEQAPALLRFEADARNRAESKIRLDDYTLTAAEIEGVSGTAPVGYRPSATCHGVRLSDDSSDAAHIYWDHDNRRFDSWTQ